MYKVVEEPSGILITLADVKEFARITNTAIPSPNDDILLQTILDGAIDFCEGYTNLSIASKKYAMIWKYRNACDLAWDHFEVRKGVVTEVESIKRNYMDGDSHEYDLTGIELDNYKQNSVIYLNGAGFQYGTHPTRPFEVYFTAGYTESTLPKDLKTAIMQLTTYWYENREVTQIMDENNVAEMPMGTTSILNKYRLVRL